MKNLFYLVEIKLLYYKLLHFKKNVCYVTNVTLKAKLLSYFCFNKLNFNFPVEKYKRQDRVKRSDVVLPKGVRVQSSYYNED